MSGRVRAGFWIVLALCLLWWDIRSHRQGDVVRGSLIGTSTVELVSWEGKMAVILTFDGPSLGGWHYQRIPRDPDWAAMLDFLLRYGWHFHDPSVGTGFLFCLPIWSVLLVPLVSVEGFLYFRRRKLPVDDTPDAGIAERHE